MNLPSVLGNVFSIGKATRFRGRLEHTTNGIYRSVALDQVNDPSLRCLRQQTSYAISRVVIPPVQRRASDPWTDRTRLPELDEKAVEVQPLTIDPFSNGFFDVGTGVDKRNAGEGVDRDMLEILASGGDGLECHGDPCDG